MLTMQQRDQLLKPINPSRVKQLPDGQRHLEAWDVRAHLIRIFGHGGFSIDLLDYTCLYETNTTTKNGAEAVRVGYQARVRLTLPATGATYTEASFGEALMPTYKRGDAHDMALKTAQSQALKRCAVNLGDQFGLSLYSHGNAGAVVGRTLDLDPAVASDGQQERAS